MERMMGVEPTSSAWKAEIIAVIPHPHIKNIKSNYLTLLTPSPPRHYELVCGATPLFHAKAVSQSLIMFLYLSSAHISTEHGSKTIAVGVNPETLTTSYRCHIQ